MINESVAGSFNEAARTNWISRLLAEIGTVFPVLITADFILSG